MQRKNILSREFSKNKLFGNQQVNVTVGFRITKRKLQALDGIDTFERFNCLNIC